MDLFLRDDDENSDIDILIIADDGELIEDEISDEVMDILLYQKEHVLAIIISEEHYKTKDFFILKKCVWGFVIPDEIE